MGIPEWSLVVAALGSALTGLYTLITYLMLSSMNKQINILEKPNIVIGLQKNSHREMVRLVVINSGRSPAYSVKLTLEKDVVLPLQFHTPIILNNLDIFNTTIDCLMPGSAMYVDLFPANYTSNRRFLESDSATFNINATHVHKGQNEEGRVKINIKNLEQADVAVDLISFELKNIATVLNDIEKKVPLC